MLTTVAILMSLTACYIAYRLWRLEKLRKAWDDPDSVRADTIIIRVRLNKKVPGSVAKQIAIDLRDEIVNEGIIIDDPRVNAEHNLYADTIDITMR